METIAIVGVGLIGGSFALALRRAGFHGAIVGVSSDEAIEKALTAGAIDAGASLEDAVSRADLVYLAQPISRILEVIPRLQPLMRPDALVTDAGSTKRAIVEAADQWIAPGQFLGGHPLAGKETRGVESATAALFEGRDYVLTPVRKADIESPAAMDFTSWLKKIGANTLVMKPNDHDRTLAFTSHLPQLASTALAALLSQTDRASNSVFGPALVDSTRLALSPYDIWKDIFKTNQMELEHALDGYIAMLQSIRANLQTDEMDGYFRDGAEFAGKIRRTRTI